MESFGQMMVSEITNMGQYNNENPAQFTSIESTSLNSYRLGSNWTALGVAMEQLFQNITISFLSSTTYS